MAEKAKKKGSRIGRLIKWALGLSLLGIIGVAAYWYFLTLDNHDIYEFVAEDAVFVVEADDPIENWQALSKTKVWRHMKKNALFADIEEDCNYLDTLIRDNKQIFSLISSKKLLVVAQMTKADDYDFVYLMDLKEGGKIANFMGIFKGVLNTFGLPMTSKKIAGYDGYGIGEGRDEVLLTFAGNILVASYSNTLITKALHQAKMPFYSNQEEFLNARKWAYKSENKESLAKVYFNFDQLDEYMAVFMDEVTGTVTSLSENLNYSAFDLKMHDDYAEMTGLTTVDMTLPSLPNVLSTMPKGEIRCTSILPSTTSFFMSIDFADFDQFYDQISATMHEDDGYKDYEKYKDQAGGFLGVSKSTKKQDRKSRRGKDINYFDWIGQEIAMALVPINESGSKQGYVAIFHAPDKENSIHDLKTIEKKIKNRTPVKFDQYEYRGHEISFLEMKGFFKLFLGKMFNKFDKPKYVILDEFVAFSNDTSALHQIIDVSHGSKPNLPMEPGFRNFYKRFEANSNYFVYLNGLKLYPFLPSFAGAETAADIRKNEKFITCFPHGGLQLLADEGKFESRLYFEFKTEEDTKWWEKLPNQ